MFAGRENEISILHDTIGAEGVSSPSAATIRRASRHVISGLGGIGKTRLAVEYALKYANEFNALLFAPANTPGDLTSSLAALCEQKLLNLPLQTSEDKPKQCDAVLEWLQNHRDWLLILDNVDTQEAAEAVEDLLTKLPSCGHVLITSRLPDWKTAVTHIPVGLLTARASIDFLFDSTKGDRPVAESDQADARKLVEMLDRLPLALTQAAAYMRVMKVTFKGYIGDWEQAHIDVLKWYDKRQMNKYPTALAVTWKASFDRLNQRSKELMYILACCAPDPVPEFLLTCEIPAAVDTTAFNKRDIRTALADLCAYSLVQWDDGYASVSVHRLVQDVTVMNMPTNDRTVALLRAIMWLDAAYSAGAGELPIVHMRSAPMRFS